MRAQSAIEMLVLAVVMLGFISIIYIVATDAMQKAVADEKLRRSVAVLAKTADEVYSLGSGTKKYAEIDLPAGVSSVTLSDKAIIYRYVNASGTTDYWESTIGNVTGKLPTDEGKQKVQIEMLDNGYVRIGSGLSLQPRNVIKTVNPGGTDSQVFTLGNYTDNGVSGITYTRTNIAGYVTLSSTVNSLASNESDDFTANISVPSGESAKTVTGSIDISTAEGYAEKANVQIVVPQVLTSMTVATYSDAGHSNTSSSFTQGNTVYYLVSLKDQTSQPLNVNNLDINISIGGTNKDTIDNASTSSGNYSGIFATDANSTTGSYTIDATATSVNTMSGSAIFSLAAATGTQDKDCFAFDWSTSTFTTGGKYLTDWKIENTCSSENITITHMIVSGWGTSDNDNARLDVIRLNNTSVWSTGGATDGQELNITDFTINASTTYTSNDKLQFSQKVNDDSEDFQITFKFSDNSTYTTSIYSP